MPARATGGNTRTTDVYRSCYEVVLNSVCAFHSCARYRRLGALFCVQQSNPLVESSKVTPWLRIRQVPADLPRRHIHRAGV